MASITLTGDLLDPDSSFSAGDKIRFIHKTTTGSTIKGAVSVEVIPDNGSYVIELQYGNILVEYKDTLASCYVKIGVVTVNQDSTATSLPELLNAIVPPTDEQLLEFQAILADCVSAKNAAEGFADDAAQSAIDAANSAASVDWLSIRYSKLDNPLTHLFKKNKLVDTLEGVLAWTRATTATYMDRYGVIQTAAIDEPRQEAEGWLIEGASTNVALNSFDALTWGVTGNTVKSDSGIESNIPTVNWINVTTDNTQSWAGSRLSSANGTDINYNFTVSALVSELGSNNACQIALNQSSKGQSILFDLSTGVVTAGSGFGGYVETGKCGMNRIGNAWLIWANFDGSQFTGLLTSSLSLHANPSQVGAGEGVRIAASQIEALPAPSSLIQTTDSSVTRVADNVVVSANLSTLSQEHSISFDVNVTMYDGFGNDRLITFDNPLSSAFARSMVLLGSSPNVLLDYYNNSQVGATFPTNSLGQFVSTYDEVTVNKYADGSLSGSDTESPISDNSALATGFYFGVTGDALINCHMSDFRIYDFALNAAEVSFLAGE